MFVPAFTEDSRLRVGLTPLVLGVVCSMETMPASTHQSAVLRKPCQSLQVSCWAQVVRRMCSTHRRPWSTADAGISASVLVAAGQPSGEGRAPGGNLEGPGEQLARLRNEAAELLNSLSGLGVASPAANAGDDAADGSGTAPDLYRSLVAELAAGATELQAQLTTLAQRADLLPTMSTTSAVRAAAAARVDVSTRVQQEVDAFTSGSAGTATGAGSGSGAGANGGDTASDRLTVEVFRPSGGATASDAVATAGALPKLEARVAALEKRLGCTVRASSRLRGGTVMAALKEVDCTLALLTPSRMASLLDQARSLVAEFETLYTTHKKVCCGGTWLMGEACPRPVVVTCCVVLCRHCPGPLTLPTSCTSCFAWCRCVVTALAAFPSPLGASRVCVGSMAAVGSLRQRPASPCSTAPFTAGTARASGVDDVRFTTAPEDTRTRCACRLTHVCFVVSPPLLCHRHRLEAVEAAQATIAAQLQADRQVLDTMSASLAENLTAIADNIANIDARVEALASKFAAQLGAEG